jgi:hypothetical protein
LYLTRLLGIGVGKAVFEVGEHTGRESLATKPYIKELGEPVLLGFGNDEEIWVDYGRHIISHLPNSSGVSCARHNPLSHDGVYDVQDTELMRVGAPLESSNHRVDEIGFSLKNKKHESKLPISRQTIVSYRNVLNVHAYLRGRLDSGLIYSGRLERRQRLQQRV